MKTTTLARRLVLGLVVVLLLSHSSEQANNQSVAAGPTVLDEGQTLNDWRHAPLKDLDGYFPFQPPESKRTWQPRAERIRRQIKVALGLWPAPTRTPLKAVIHSPVDQGDYTVEKVYFQALPGFYVSGSLYRPKNTQGKVPGVLCPHGHGRDGRFADAGEARVKALIEGGEEKFEIGGRNPKQARCATLARMGCVAFLYDMIGYADSQQISYQLAHRFAKQRADANNAENWGLYSPQAESHLHSVMGLQIWSGIRALDFLESLPDVDSKRLAVTGASGGGTQTMLLGAIDPRPKTIVPVVMVSTSMQGGCTCENASLLRVGTGNVEFAALYAPKPQLIICADDWTREMPTKGFPDLQTHYELVGDKADVALVAHLQFKHNYNYVNRAAMYQWMNQHLNLGHEGPIVERDYPRQTAEEMTVWNDEHPKPEGGDAFERKLLRWLADDTQRQLDATTPKDEASLNAYKELVGPAVDLVIGRGLPEHKAIEYNQSVKEDDGDFIEMAGVLTHKLKRPSESGKPRQEQVPIVFLYPKDWNKQVVIWLSPKGKAGLYEDDGPLTEPVKKLLKEGTTVIGADLFYQGESLAGEKPLDKTRRVKNPREAACYTFGYNPALFARRVHDVLTVVSFVKNHGLSPEAVAVVGWEPGTGPLAAAARAQARDAIDKAVVHTHGFRFGQVDDLHSVNFLPGGAKYDDLPGMLTLAAPLPVFLAGEGKRGPTRVVNAYGAINEADQLHLAAGEEAVDLNEALKWLLD